MKRKMLILICIALLMSTLIGCAKDAGLKVKEYITLMNESSSNREASILANTYPSLLWGTINIDSGGIPDLSAVVSINFDKGSFKLTEAQSIFDNLISLLSLVTDFASYSSLGPSELVSLGWSDGPTVVATVQDIYKNLGYDFYIVLDVRNIFWENLGNNIRADIFTDLDGMLQYVGSIELSSSLIGTF